MEVVGNLMLEKRNQEIYLEVKKGGRTMVDIGNQYGMTSARVQQIYQDIQRRETLNSKDKLYQFIANFPGDENMILRTRVYHILRRPSSGVETLEGLKSFDKSCINDIRGLMIPGKTGNFVARMIDSLNNKS